MEQLKELMKLPYSMIQIEDRIELVELGIRVKLNENLPNALEILNAEKEKYFREMIEQKATHLIPTPVVWRKKFFPVTDYALKQYVIKSGIFALFILAALLISMSLFSKMLDKKMIELNKIIEPVTKSEEKKITLFKKNLEKYRPYIKEVAKVWNEESSKGQ